MSASKLLIQGLSKRFGDQVVLDAIDVDIPLGKHTTLIGRSGIGKSVFLKCIAGLMEYDAGTISLDDGGTVPHCSYLFQQNLCSIRAIMVQGTTLKPLMALNGVSEHDPVNKIVVLGTRNSLELVLSSQKMANSTNDQKRIYSTKLNAV